MASQPSRMFGLSCVTGLLAQMLARLHPHSQAAICQLGPASGATYTWRRWTLTPGALWQLLGLQRDVLGPLRS